MDVPKLYTFPFDGCPQAVHLLAAFPAPDVRERLLLELGNRAWRGNVRELRNAADRLVLGLADPNGAARVPAGEEDAGRSSLGERMACFVRSTIIAALREHGGRVGETATALGVPRKTRCLCMQKHGLARADHV